MKNLTQTCTEGAKEYYSLDKNLSPLAIWEYRDMSISIRPAPEGEYEGLTEVVSNCLAYNLIDSFRFVYVKYDEESKQDFIEIDCVKNAFSHYEEEIILIPIIKGTDYGEEIVIKRLHRKL